MCIYGVLNRFPILHNGWALAMTSWRRLCIGTRNILLNEFLKYAEENHNWLQGIKYILSVNGFRDVRLYPIHICENFHKVYKQRLDDQFVQEWKSNVLSSKQFTILSTLFNRYEMNTYLSVVNSPDNRIYTRLRIDMNVSSMSRSCKNIKDLCLLCDTEPEKGITFYP